MKKTFFNLAAICFAFAVGLAINNACADPIESMTDTELRRLVIQLQDEIEYLKKEVSDLKEKINGGGSSSTECEEFYVDGLYFDRSGNCSSILSGTVWHNDVNNTKTTQNYERDEFGRIIKVSGNSSFLVDGVETNTTSEVICSYSGKQVTMTYDTGMTYIYQYK